MVSMIAIVQKTVIGKEMCLSCNTTPQHKWIVDASYVQLSKCWNGADKKQRFLNVYHGFTSWLILL